MLPTISTALLLLPFLLYLSPGQAGELRMMLPYSTGYDWGSDPHLKEEVVLESQMELGTPRQTRGGRQKQYGLADTGEETETAGQV